MIHNEKTQLQEELQKKEKKIEETDQALSATENQVQQLLHLNNQLKSRIDERVTSLGGQPAMHNRNDDDPSQGTREDTTTITYDELRRYCFAELKERGSCERRNRCRYSHEIPNTISEKREESIHMVNQINLCINEYIRQGECHKGDQCRFSHEITEEMRNDPKTK